MISGALFSLWFPSLGLSFGLRERGGTVEVVVNGIVTMTMVY